MVVDDLQIEPLVYEIDLRVQAELRKHPGKWAALTRDRLIAVRETSIRAYEAAREAGIEAPILYHVPDTRTGYSYF